jgi:hypothetical protein
MELILEMLLNKKKELEILLLKYNDITEVLESLQKDIKDFEQVINIIELHIKINNK